MFINNIGILGPCAKQTVIAIIMNNGSEWIGTNSCKKPQTRCPRDIAKYRSGEGYHLCKEVCEQEYHAEVAALAAAGDNAEGSTLYLIGHSYICEDCKVKLEKAGVISSIIIGDFKCKLY